MYVTYCVLWNISVGYTTRSMSLFPEIDLNGTYHASSLNVATTTNMSSVINSFPETNTSFLNMNPTPVHQLDTSSIGNHESTDVSDLSPTTLESIFRLIDDFNHGMSYCGLCLQLNLLLACNATLLSFPIVCSFVSCCFGNIILI